MASFYTGNLKIDALYNQYLLIKNTEGQVIDKYRFDGNKFVRIRNRPLESQILSKIKARNIRQELFMDLLDTNIPLKVVFGTAGSGKSYLATAWALQEVHKGNYSKLVVIRNNIIAKDSTDIGAIPGDETQKLKSHCMFIADIIDEFMFDTLLQQGKIQLAFLGNMRGRSLSNSIILCSEAQNLNVNLVKMIITRIGDKSTLIFDLDWDQIDNRKFETDNGMISLVESLKGNPLVGIVELQDIERSAVAKLAALIK